MAANKIFTSDTVRDYIHSSAAALRERQGSGQRGGEVEGGGAARVAAARRRASGTAPPTQEKRLVLSKLVDSTIPYQGRAWRE